MQLTLNTDYSLRVLLYTAEHEGETISTKDISKYFNISQNHLVKVVNNLGKLGYLNLKRGRYGGGITLARSPEEINVGKVVQEIEPMDIVECFNPDKNTCRISTDCRLKVILNKAKVKFVDELKNSTLKDLINHSRVSSDCRSFKKY